MWSKKLFRKLNTIFCWLLVVLPGATTSGGEAVYETPAKLVFEPYRLPNMHVGISTELLNALLAKNTRTHAPFRENILGTTYRGTSTTDAQFSLRTEPDDDIAITLLWNATIASRSHSSTNRTDVSSRSTTHINASKKLIRQEDGWHIEPAQASTSSRSQITGLKVRRLFGRRIARRRVYQQRPTVDRSVASLAARRTRQEFDHSVNTMLASLEGDFDRRVRQPLAERDLLPVVVQQHSTNDSLQLTLLQADAEQQGTLTGFSHSVPQSAGDISLSLHQSAFNNFATDLLAGERLDEDQLAAQLGKLLGWKPLGLQRSDSEKRWSIDFDQANPLRVEFHEGIVMVTLLARGFQIDDQAIPGARLRVAYQLSVADSQLVGQRQGRIEIMPVATGPAAENVGVRFQVFRSMLSRRFDRLFPAEFTWSEPPVAQNWPPHAALYFSQLQARDEWLQIGCSLIPGSPTYSPPVVRSVK